MLIAQLVGNVWSTRKADGLNGFKLMLVEIQGGKDDGTQLVAVDTIGAGIGDRVLVSTGSAARKMLGNEQAPIDAAVVGIIDHNCPLS